MHQPIIPGLPDDLAIRCLARLSHGHHGVMEAVSTRWRDAIRSEEYSNIKAREGWCGDWLFALTSDIPDQWIAYDPNVDRWHELPPRPNLHRKYTWMDVYSCLCVCNKFFVIGGTYWTDDPCHHTVSDEVFRFDPFKKEWSVAASMRTPRTDFASCAVDGKIYVAGGWNADHPDGMHLAEVYDPSTDRWEDLPSMPVSVILHIGVAYKGKFHAIRTYGDDHGRQETVVFDPSSRRWHIKHERWFSSPNRAVVTHDRVYTANDSDEIVERGDAAKNEWRVVGKLPPVLAPDDSQLEHNVVFDRPAALGHELYVIDFEQIWVCDTRCSPLVWRETRRMCLGEPGSIEAWASLKQQV